MKFVQFEVYFLDSRLSMKLTWLSYIEIKEIKTFRIEYRNKIKHMVINHQISDGKQSIRTIPRYVPCFKDQFKEAFGLDWDNLR